MAHVLTLADGTTTINLTDGTSCYVERYTPATPDTFTQSDNVEYVRDGGDIRLVTRRNVTETLEIVLVAASSTAMQTLVNSVEELLLAAERKQRWGVGDEVYLTQKLDGESYTWRSETFTGRLEYDDDVLTSGWANLQVEARLHITRRHYWELNSADLLLDITSDTTTIASPSATIYNTHGTGGGNWFQIADTETIGTLPAPLNIKLTYKETSAIYGDNYYLTANTFSAPTTLTPYLYGTDATPSTESLTWASAIDHDDYASYAYRWELGSRLSTMAGQWWRALAVFTTSQEQTYARINTAFHVGGLYIYNWSGEEVVLGPSSNSQIADLGIFPVPDVSNTTQLDLVVSLRDSGAGSSTLSFLQITPALQFRHLDQKGFQFPDQDDFVQDNGIVRKTYLTDVSASPDDVYPLLTGRGEYIHVYPGVTQRFYFLMDVQSGGMSSVLGDEWQVSAWYRPRRLTM
jgi:hypothetical protein